ncbi:hypothetical protein [Streptomyces sp. NPDC059166]|uniref:hypothetical protein n=1 Tax=Streptomyces sp. NPDC059166 TaxID=3346752 RepID=UPI0036942FB8
MRDTTSILRKSCSSLTGSFGPVSTARSSGLTRCPDTSQLPLSPGSTATATESAVPAAGGAVLGSGAAGPEAGGAGFGEAEAAGSS